MVVLKDFEKLLSGILGNLRSGVLDSYLWMN